MYDILKYYIVVEYTKRKCTYVLFMYIPVPPSEKTTILHIIVLGNPLQNNERRALHVNESLRSTEILSTGGRLESLRYLQLLKDGIDVKFS